ncbi:uncharacterized protein LOC117560271 [Gymnodraco acuticeps]|uniref:Uncharacterized protein LOC117560271 n=1 Tax=Gymnodraco acuticeps TaxID=8218 RepID=A0A6P8W5C8_GYMAC|nr:uncharacterized protein LOC117560271 [Gymnodraco acuticeps]
MSSACSDAAFMDSTMARNWGPNSPSELIGASSKTFLAGSVTAACCNQRWRWIQAVILAWETATAAHSVSAVLAALAISSASSGATVVDRSTNVTTELVTNAMLFAAADAWNAHWCARSAWRATYWSLGAANIGRRPATKLACLTPKNAVKLGSRAGVVRKTSSVNPSTLVKGTKVATGALKVLGFAAAPSWYRLMAGKRGQIGSLLPV